VQEGEPRDDVALLALRPAEGGMSQALAGSRTAMPEEIAALEVPGGPEAPAVARNELQRRLAGRVPRRVLDDAGLLVSELVTNSIVHGGVGASGVLGLRLALRGERVRIEVSDPGPGFDPEAPRSGPDEPGGYGLFLVTQLADAWGIAPGDEPTTVWFELGQVG
jgi:anti-sigma regulatory factor (Ser/Thr protein kinase)